MYESKYMEFHNKKKKVYAIPHFKLQFPVP